MALSRKEMSRDLKYLVDTQLMPSEDFLRCGRFAVDKIYKALAESEFSINRIKIAGSMGKGTAIEDTDFDVVVFMNNIQPPFTRALMQNMEDAIMYLPGYRRKSLNSHCLSFVLEIEGHKLDFDLLAAANLVSQKQLEAIGGNMDKAQGSQVLQRLKKYYAMYQKNYTCLSTSLCEQTVLFLKKKPKDVINVIKLAKYWNTNIKGMPYVRGRSYMIELVAAYAQKNRPSCGLLQRFIRFLELMTKFGDLKVIFGYHYNSSTVPEDVQAIMRPLILDPCNPYNNIAKDIDDRVIQTFENYAKDSLDLIRSGELEDVDTLFLIGYDHKYNYEGNEY